MQCAWESLINLLPFRFRAVVDRCGRNTMQELRLRLEQPPEIVTKTGSFWLQDKVTAYDIQFCINAGSEYSPWSAQTIQNGYITAAGGHRIGICGDTVSDNKAVTTIRNPTSLCIRVARDFPGIAEEIPVNDKSILVLGPPGSGKTTLLRDMIRIYSNTGDQHISVIDERGELFPIVNGKTYYEVGKRTDIMTGCKKCHGIDAVLRCMGPGVIAVDEITAEEDCAALMQAGWCGVRLFATAHASCVSDLFSRPLYRPIVETKLFDTYIILRRDKSWFMERIDK